jgi:hypothetical protein
VRITKDHQNDDPDDGRCRVCGSEGPLTFEHVPPRAANNARRAEMLGLDAWLKRDDDGAPGARGKILQRGSGVFSLCKECNNRAGQLFVPELVKWTRIGAKAYLRDGLADQADRLDQASWTKFTIMDVHPARLLKQIATMALAISPAWLVRALPELATYAREPDVVGFPAGLNVYLAFFGGPWVRFAGGAWRLSGLPEGDEPATGPIEEHFVIEIAYPPFAYILSIDEKTPAVATTDITNFADLRITQRAERAEVNLLNGFGHTALPLDYRSKARLLADREAGRDTSDRNEA